MLAFSRDLDVQYKTAFVPFAERRRQIAPRRSGPPDPDHAVQRVPMVLGLTPAARGGLVRKGAKIAHSSSVINPRMIVGPEFARRSVENHSKSDN
jgi:hypothetical protein